MRLTLQLILSIFLLIQVAWAEPTNSDMNLVRSVLASELGIPVSSIADSKTLARQVKPADSLNFVEVVLELEKRTKKEITDAAMKKVIGNFSMKTVAEQITVKQLAEVLSISPVKK